MPLDHDGIARRYSRASLLVLNHFTESPRVVLPRSAEWNNFIRRFGGRERDDKRVLHHFDAT